MGYDTVNKFLENQNVVHKREYFTGGISVRIYYSSGVSTFWRRV